MLEEDGVEPDCERCERPDLLPGNQLAWQIIQRVIRIKRRLAYYKNRPVVQQDPEIDHEALRLIFDLDEIPKHEQKTIYDKILLYEYIIRNHLTDD